MARCNRAVEGALCIPEFLDDSVEATTAIILNGVDLDVDLLLDCDDDDNCVITYNGQTVGYVQEGTKYYSLPTWGLVEGRNTLVFNVEAENGEERTYTFTINRKASNGEIPITDAGDDGNIGNPYTGSMAIYIVIILLVLSLGYMGYYYYKKN